MPTRGLASGVVANLKMKKILIIILLFQLMINSFSQDNNSLNNYLSDLFNGFPIKMELDSTETQYLNKFEYNKSKNIYNDTKTDYRKSLIDSLPIEFQPESAQIEHFYALRWGGGPEHSLITLLTLDYGTDEDNNCEKQLMTIVNELIQKTEKKENFKIFADAGEVGSGYEFFQNTNDTFPILTINFIYKSCTNKDKHIYIAYIRKIED